MNQDAAMQDLDGMSLSEQDAFSLSESAILIDQSRADKNRLAAALDHNLQLWVGIRTLMSRGDPAILPEIRQNLTRLANYVADATLARGIEMADSSLNTLININLQVSEGLLEGAKRAGTR